MGKIGRKRGEYTDVFCLGNMGKVPSGGGRGKKRQRGKGRMRKESLKKKKNGRGSLRLQGGILFSRRSWVKGNGTLGVRQNLGNKYN